MRHVLSEKYDSNEAYNGKKMDFAAVDIYCIAKRLPSPPPLLPVFSKRESIFRVKQTRQCPTGGVSNEGNIHVADKTFYPRN